MKVFLSLIMAEELSIFSQNCRGGLSVATKRRDLFQYVRSKKFNIVCLQDTHINPKLESFIKSEWGFDAYFSSYTTNSRGVMILINNNLEKKRLIGLKLIQTVILSFWILILKESKLHWYVYMDPMRIVTSLFYLEYILYVYRMKRSLYRFLLTRLDL